jgi:hypothetical protein
MLFLLSTPAWAADRTTCVVPRASDSPGGEPFAGVTADQAYGDQASDGWKAYVRVWRAHHDDPSDSNVRRFLGLPLHGVLDAQPKRSRSAPLWLGWRPGSYQEITTPHFTIFTHATSIQSKRVAEDLERCYWVWTQMFFPLWEASAQVTATLGALTPQESVSQFLDRRPSRITVRRKLRVVLFRDAREYQRSLGRSVPGIERSTGYYNDQNQTTFLYVGDVDDAATRRHEMVHQLFREATRSGLRQNQMPAEEAGFWLIEGIAGYFESLSVGDEVATVGGWDASRLQFARYRILGLADVMPMDELQLDGRAAAQQREDLARWYAHAIAQTHRLMDSGNPQERHWLYHQLADKYRIDSNVEPGVLTSAAHQSLNDFLRIGDSDLRDNRIEGPLASLCLNGCQVTADGLNAIPASQSLDWLDLSRLPIGNDSVRRLAPAPQSIQRLSLERTQIDAGLGDWFAGAINLRELDLSSTAVDDSIMNTIGNARRLQVLWMTATKVTDASIDRIAGLRQLQAVDLQRSGVTSAGLSRLQKLRPDLSINPLEIRSQ